MKDNWRFQKLKDIANIFAGGDAPKENFSKEKTEEYNIPVIANAVKDNGLYGYTNKARVTKPSITVAARGSGTGHTEFRAYPFVPIVRLIVLTPHLDVIMPEFLMHAIKNLTIMRSGSAIPQLTVPMIKGYLIPIPPLSEQKQIVTILDKAFAAIDKAKANIERNIENAKELFQSKLNEIFSQKGEGWEEKTLGEVCNLIGGGTPAKSNENYYQGNIFWATVRDMNHDKLIETDHKISQEGLENSSSNLIPKNHVVIATRVGLGKVCILQQDTAINQDLKGIKPKPKCELLNEYIFWWYKSIADTVIKAGTGATVQGVKLPFIKGLKIPLVSLREQGRLVTMLNNFSKDITDLEFNYLIKISNLNKLKKSILQKAFAGELTEKDVLV